MKYKPELYAKALYESFSKNKNVENEILWKFLRIVKKNGDWSGIMKILRAFNALLVRIDGGRIILVESTRDLPGSATTELLEKFKKEDKFEFINNQSLVAGVRITIDGERELDFSFVHKLNKLFE